MSPWGILAAAVGATGFGGFGLGEPPYVIFSGDVMGEDCVLKLKLNQLMRNDAICYYGGMDEQCPCLQCYPTRQYRLNFSAYRCGRL